MWPKRKLISIGSCKWDYSTLFTSDLVIMVDDVVVVVVVGEVMSLSGIQVWL